MTFFRSVSRGVIGLLSVGAIALSSLGLANSAPAQAAEPAPVGTTTTVSLENNPTVYGDIAMFSATVKIDAAAILNGHEVRFEVDGVLGNPNYLIYAGEGKFKTLFPTTTVLGVGTHTIVAKFPGVADADSGNQEVLPSESEPFELTINQAPTTTTMTAPSSTTAFVPIDVSASVAAAAGVRAEPLTGSAVLLADDLVLETKDLDAGHEVTFSEIVVPWATEELSVAFRGDAAGNYEISASAPSAFEVTPLATTTTLDIADAEVRADEPLELSVTVQHADDRVDVDPAGGLEIFVDGVSTYAEYPSTDLDPLGNRTARFDVQLTGVLPGLHDIQARYLPADGFGDSESQEVEVTVTAIETVLTPSVTEVTTTQSRPVTIDLSATELAPQVPPTQRTSATSTNAVDGYVQAFVEGAPFGDPAILVDGEGQIELAGLPVGLHDVDLRFRATDPGFLNSSADVRVIVSAGADSGAAAGGSGATLSHTGGSDPTLLIAGAGALVLAAGAVLFVARRRA